MYNNPTLNISSGSFTVNNFTAMAHEPTVYISSSGAITINNLYGMRVFGNGFIMNVSAHVIQTYYGIHSATSSASLANGSTITTAYSGYFASPNFGTTAVALYSDNMAIGTSGTTPPTNGLLVAGIIKNTNLTANTIIYSDASKQLASVSLNPNLTLTTGILDTVQNIQTTSNPQFASLGLGAAANSLYGIYNNFTIASVTTSNYAAYFSNGTFTLSTAATNGALYGNYIGNTFVVNHASGTLNNAMNIYSKPTFTNTTGTFSTATNLYLDTPTMSGTIPTAYGIYQNVPTGATTNYGYFQAGTFTKTGDVAMKLANTFSPTTGAALFSMYNSPTISVASGNFTISNFYNSFENPNINISSASVITIANMYGIAINPNSVVMNTAAHVIQNYYGIKSESAAASLANGASIQTAYSGYFAAPGFGTTKIALWANDITLGTATNYAPLIVDANKNLVSVTTGMSNSGWVLTSNGTGAAPTWQAGGAGGGVPSVTGTADQILINGGTSAVTTAATFTIPSSFIAPGSIQSTLTMGVGMAVSTDFGINLNYTYSGAIPFYTGGVHVTGTITVTGGTADTIAGVYIEPTFDFQSSTSSITAGIYSAPWFKATAGSSHSWYGIHNAPFLTNTGASDYYYGYFSDTAINLVSNLSAIYGIASNIRVTAGSGTITNAYNIYVDRTSKLSGTVTTAYGLYVNNPTAGTTNIALYSANANLNYVGVAPPTGGMIMSGKLGVGNNNPTNQLEVTGTARFSSSVICATGALATTATDGYIYIPSCAGIPTGVPTSQTGTCAMAYDTTNNDLYIYDGTWQKATFNASDVSFESINNNEACYAYSITYDGSNRYSTITYTAPGGNIVKTFSYNGDGTINTIVLSGAGLPTIAYTTKTYTYTSGSLTSVAYS
jgi:hypothetical protein